MLSPCTVDGCTRNVTPGGGRGLCQVHYMRLRRTGTTDENPEPHKRRNSVVCSVDDCDRRTVAFDLCDLHYRRSRRGGEGSVAAVPRQCNGCDGPIEAERGSRAVWCLSCLPLVNKLRPYDLDVRGYLAMYAKQGGRCLVCEEHRKVLDVEHCHVSSRVRGLCCGRCNTAMGFLGDDPERLRRAALYLEGKLVGR